MACGQGVSNLTPPATYCFSIDSLILPRVVQCSRVAVMWGTKIALVRLAGASNESPTSLLL
jgi:hypothetical protein